MENGSFLNMCENKQAMMLYGKRDITHEDLMHFLIVTDSTKELLHVSQWCNKSKAIRINDGTFLYINEDAYIDLNDNEPTKEQYDSILKWLDFLMNNSIKKYILITYKSTHKKFEFINKVNKDGLLPEQIIKEIKKIYREQQQ